MAAPEQEPHGAGTTTGDAAGGTDAQPFAESTDGAGRAAVEAFNVIAESDRARQFQEVVEATFGGEITEQSYEDFVLAAGYLGHFAMSGILAWAADSRADRFRQRAPKMGLGPAAIEMIASVVMVYGSRIRRAFYLSNRGDNVDDWHSIDYQVAREIPENEYIVNVVITKKNRKQFTIRGGPNSIARWARELLEALLVINDQNAFSEPTRERLLTDCKAVIAMFDSSSDSEDRATRDAG